MPRERLKGRGLSGADATGPWSRSIHTLPLKPRQQLRGRTSRRRGGGATERATSGQRSGRRAGSGAAAGRQRRSEQRDQQSNLSPLLPLPTKLWATSKTNSRTALGSGYGASTPGFPHGSLVVCVYNATPTGETRRGSRRARKVDRRLGSACVGSAAVGSEFG